MKKNLIIIVFCLFMLGTFCFNYSYAKTVTRTDAFCKNIWNNTDSAELEKYKSDKGVIRALANAAGYKTERDWNYYNEKWELFDANKAVEDQYKKMQQQDRYGSEGTAAKACIEAWCYYIWSKCLSCDGIKLNTNVPFIWNCIPSDSQSEAFPLFIGGLIKFAMSLLMLAGFLCILIWGVMITAWKTADWKDLIMKVVRALAALGASGVILKIINPNFFS
jgi:hypothetical protein